VCDALDYAHNLTDDSGQDLGIIHRDVSPSNVIVAEGGVVKLIDFGIAKASAAGMQTMSGTIKGKFSYMAPEYLAGKIDSRADLFALGVITHELLANRPLFQGRDDMDTLYRVKQMKIESPRKWNEEIPEEIDSIVMTALDRDPDARWQRAAAMRVALTTEAKRLGMAVLDQQVAQWCERVFENALGDTSTPAPTRVLGTSPSISIDSVEIEVRAGTQPGHGNAKVDEPDEMLQTHMREPVRSVRPSEHPKGTGSPGGSLAPPLEMPLPPPPRTLLGAPAMKPTPPILIEPAPVAPEPRRMGNLTIMLLLLVTAAAAGAVVYFGLPYVQ
jgi:serine/threonine protein kinase